MIVASIYARFSSDNQRDVSIEIQVDAGKRLIEQAGWKLGEIYSDYAKSGTDDNRPQFQRAISDGIAGKYDVLVVYKNDRFARNIEVSRRYKRCLRAAGRRIVSVREGESKDTPDDFLHEVMDEAYAEYYSRNLSVVIKDGIAKNAENCKASGRRLFGLSVDENDFFIIDKTTGPMVYRFFHLMYEGGWTRADLVAYTKANGIKTIMGNDFTIQAMTRLLTNPAYTGLYIYCGVVVDGGIPQIVERHVFEGVQLMIQAEKARKRRRRVNDYLLTDKLWCLKCGAGMNGRSGTGKSGRKYTYYGCTNDGCSCGNLPSEHLESTVIDAVKELIADESVVSSMIECVMDYAESLPNNTPSYEAERSEVMKRRDKLVESIAEGIPASAVRDAVVSCEERLQELDKLIMIEEFEHKNLMDESEVREYINKFVSKTDSNVDRAKLLVSTFIEAVYANRSEIAIVFALGGENHVDFAEIKELVTQRTPSNPRSEGVRIVTSWWR